MRATNPTEMLDEAEAELAEAEKKRATAALRLVASIVKDHSPKATRVYVTETDQDLSGALVTTSITGNDGVAHNELGIDTDVVLDLLDPALSHLCDRNFSTWAPFFVGERSERGGTSGYLDLRKIRQDLEPAQAFAFTPTIELYRHADGSWSVCLDAIDSFVGEWLDQPLEHDPTTPLSDMACKIADRVLPEQWGPLNTRIPVPDELVAEVVAAGDEQP